MKSVLITMLLALYIRYLIALMNALNHKNVFYYEYRSDHTIETVYQFTCLPVEGIEIEF